MKNENGIERSVILKGQTLVNLFPKMNNRKITLDSNYDNLANINQSSLKGQQTYEGAIAHTIQDIKPNTMYTIIYEVISNEITNTGGFLLNNPTSGKGSVFDKEIAIRSSDKLGIYKDTMISKTDLTGAYSVLRMQNATARGSLEIGNIMLIEGNYTKQDIPYFEGMQSVKMPSVKTTGKNLWEHGDLSDFDAMFINDVIPEGSYYFSGEPTTTYDAPVVIAFRDGKNNVIAHANIGEKITINKKAYQIAIYSNGHSYANSIGKFLSINNFMMEKDELSSYEPYQSNILTVNEEVELRGIGNVQDTLDLLTGEVTERIGEIVLDGSEDWAKGHGNSDDVSSLFYIKIPNAEGGFNSFMCDIIPSIKGFTPVNGTDGIYVDGSSEINIRISNSKLVSNNINGFKQWLSQNPITVQYQFATESIKTVDLTIVDQDNQPQERMKLFPNGYINTSSSTFPPILELKGITHNNKLNMTTTNGTNNTQLTTLDNLALDGIICRDGTVVRDSYDVESGLYTKRVFRFTIDEEFIEKYRNNWNVNLTSYAVMAQFTTKQYIYPKPISNTQRGVCSNMEHIDNSGRQSCFASTNGNIYIRILKENLVSHDVDGLLDWIKRNGAIEVAYEMATPEILNAQADMTPYVSTRPYQGEINSQGNALESSFLDYTQEESILSPKPLGEGDVLRWEQGSQCYVYENDKDYIPLTDYNQKVGTVLDLEDDEQFVENLDGGEIVVDVPFKEKAVYERELVSYEDTVIYPTNTSADPDGKVEVDYICGATWQNPDDLSDIQHLGTLREDGQYDVTIRRSGDDEIRFMDGTTHLSLDHEGLNPSEFELTYYNKDGVEVGKYGDTSHTLEGTVLDSKLETGMVYGDTLVNIQDKAQRECWGLETTGSVPANLNYGYFANTLKRLKPSTKYIIMLTKALPSDKFQNYCFFSQNSGESNLVSFKNMKYAIATTKSELTTDTTGIHLYLKNGAYTKLEDLRTFVKDLDIMVIEYQEGLENKSIPYFEGVDSTIVNGFTTTGKNLFGFNDKYEIRNSLTKHEILDMNSIVVSPDTTSTSWINAGFYNYYLPHKTTDYFIISRKEEVIKDNPYMALNLYDADDDGQMTRLDAWEYDGYKHDLVQFKKDGERANIRFYCGSNNEKGTVKYSDIQITKYSQRPSRINEEFEPHHSIQHTLPTPITLNKVGDVVDTYNVATGVETRNHVSAKFDGSEDENWVVRFDTYGSARNKIYGAFINNMYQSGNNTYTDLFVTNYKSTQVFIDNFVGTEKGQWGVYLVGNEQEVRLITPTGTTMEQLKEYLQANPLEIVVKAKTPQTIQHTLIPSTVGMMQEPTFILPQPLRSVPNGICDRLYWDENKGHYCIEKRIGHRTLTGDDTWSNFSITSNGFARAIKGDTDVINWKSHIYCDTLYGVLEYSNFLNYRDYIDANNNPIKECMVTGNPSNWAYMPAIRKERLATQDYNGFRQWFADNPTTVYYTLNKTEVINLPHLNRKLELPTCPDKLPVGYKAVHPKMNPQIGLTIPYKQLNPPSQPQNLDFQMNKEDYVLTWNDVKEARQYNVILNDNVIATTKVPFYNTGEEIHGYILVEAQNEIADNLSKELYVKTVPKAPAQLTVAHNGLTDNYDFEISFIKSTSSLADRYTVQYRVDGGEWIIQDIPANEVDANVKVLWKFSVFEIKNQIEVWATATNDMGTNDILPLSTYYMTPTPQWTYRINSREVFLRWVDESPYDTQYKLRYQYKSDGIYRYAHFEGDKEEIGQLYEAVVALAEDDEVTLELCVISDRENLYCKPIKASKALDPNILPPKNFNYRWLSRGLIEFYWEDVYDVDLEYEAIVEHRLSGETTWIEDRRVFSATDTEGTGTVYRLQYQMEDLEEIRVKVRMKWAMNETEWSESLTTVFIPVEGNPPQWIRRTQTQEGLLVEWEAQEYIDSYHVYVKGDGVELQHLETKDNFIYVDIDYSNPIDIEIYEVSRFTGGIEAEPSDSMRFIPHQNKQQMINNIYHPDTLKYELEVNTVQKTQKASYQINDINTTPDVRTREAMDVSISSPFIITYHPLEVDVHQKGVKSYGVSETHIKTLDVKTRETVEVLTFERITDKYGMDFTVYTPFASKYPVNLEINQVRIVCLGDSLTSGHPLYWAESGTGDVTASYPYQLAKRLKNQYEVINKGYGYFM